MNPLTTIDLDIAAANGCQEPDCPGCDNDGRIYLNQKCHAGAPLDVIYTQGSGVLRVQCHVCLRVVTEIAVAGPSEPPKPRILTSRIR